MDGVRHCTDGARVALSAAAETGNDKTDKCQCLIHCKIGVVRCPRRRRLAHVRVNEIVCFYIESRKSTLEH